MAELESACILNRLPEELPAGYSRLYYGAEFCFWRLPGTDDLLAAKESTNKAGWKFTLVTPVVGEDERKRLATLLKFLLPNLEPGDEVLISDWGTLELVRGVREDLVVVLGRALSGQKRGPRILDMTLTAEQKDYFQRGSWHNQEAVSLLKEQGIMRVEQDNLFQGLAPLPSGLKGSLHIPYAMVTSSRNCPFRPQGDSGFCPSPCGEIFTLKSTETEVLLYQDGNTQFLYNPKRPDNLAELHIDRIVTSVSI